MTPVLTSIQALTLTRLAAKAALKGHPEAAPGSHDGFAKYVSALALGLDEAQVQEVRNECEMCTRATLPEGAEAELDAQRHL